MDIKGNVIINEESRGMAVWRDDLYVAMGFDPGTKARGLYRVDPVAGTRECVIPHGDDLHGVYATKDAVFAIDAKNTKLHWYDGTDVHVGKAMEPFNASHHLNDIFIDGEDQWATCFGLGLLKNGVIVDKRCEKNKPHSPFVKNDKWWYCASEMQAVAIPGFLRTDLGGFTRGLTITERTAQQNETLYVGLSRQRASQDVDCGAVVMRNPTTLDIWGKIELPCLEVYAICQI